MNINKIGIYITISLILCLFIFSSSISSLNRKERPESNINCPQEKLSVKNPEYYKRDTLPGEEEISAVVGHLENMYGQLEDVKDELNKTSFSAEAVVDEVGSERQALYKWVKENTLLVPYKGSLRGARGVLMDRLGSSLDRALLLYELLYEAGYDVRLARGTLSEEKAEELLYKLQKLSSSFSPPDQDDDFRSQLDYADKFALKYQIDSTQLKGKLKNQNKKQKQILKEIIKRSNKQAEAIISAVKKVNAIKSSDDESAEIKALQEYWWVQSNEDENWMDLDPCLPEFEPGQTLAEADDYYDPEDLEEDELHLITIRLIIEQWSRGNVSEKTVLEHTLKAPELVDKHITLQHYPLDWPEDKNMFEKEDLIQNLKKVILEQKTWIPTLILEEDETEGTVFKDTGELIKEKGGKGGLSVFSKSMFKAFSGGEDKKKTDKDAVLTAEWIEYELCSPGQPVRTIRREIFDFLGPAQRGKENIAAPAIMEDDKMERCLSILGQTEVLVLTSRISTEFIEYLNIDNLFSSRDPLLELFPMVNEAEPHEVLTQMTEISSAPGKLYDTALARSKLENTNKGIFLNHPNIISFHSQLKQNSSGELIKYRGLDIVENDVAVLDGDGFFTRLRQGVLDTNIEAFMMDSEHEVYNTSEIFNKGSEWITIADQDKDSFEKIELDDDTKERIMHDLERGYIVITPKKAVKINGKEYTAWWRINPETGHTLGMGKYGWGQAIVEYVEIAQTMIQLKLQIESYMGIISCLMNTAAYVLAGGDTKEEHKLAVAKCIWDTVCNHIMGKLSGYFLSDTIWSNFIVEKTVDWATGSICGLAY